MKLWSCWLALASCVLPAGYGDAPQPQPQPQPVAASPAPAPRPIVVSSAITRQIAARYDDLFDRLAAAQQETSAHRDEQATASFREVVSSADQLLGSLGDRIARVRFVTRHDGTLDGTLLIANLKAARTQAAHLGDEASERFIEALESELHAQTPGQRAVLRQHGRPEVARLRGQTCWVYRDAGAEERFCWTSDGHLAKRTTTPSRTAPPPAPPSAPVATTQGDDTSAWQPPAQNAPPPVKHSVAYYAAATFASGPCSFGNCLKDGWTTSTPGGDVRTSCNFGECAKDGWTSTHPDNTTSTTSCHFGDCFKDGWTTTHPDNTSSETSCSFGDCMKDGWSTTMPDGSTSTTSCSFSECLKSGWTTTLPSGTSITCACNFSDCLANGATCN